MSQFRLLRQTRQMTEYSCGASALQSVLSYWGRDVDEETLMTLLDTNDEVGTYPENLVSGARALGFDAEFRENVTLDELQRCTSQGHPVIVLAQLWRSEKDTPASAADEWDCGHYIVVLAVDADYVYFQDPFIRMGKGFVSRPVFEEHWHQIMGGSALAKSPVLNHLAIFVKGDRPAAPSTASRVANLNLAGRLGSMTAISFHFPRHLLPFDFLDEMRKLFGDSLVRPDAYVLLRKDSEGRLSAMQGGRLEDMDEIVAVNALIAVLAAGELGGEETTSRAKAAAAAAAAGDFGLAADDLKRRAERLAAGHSEVIVLLENRWEVLLREVTSRFGGTIASEKLVSRAALKALDEALGWSS
ncbi:MAG TPA: cysteine peptidase family C39 domain-containing protein [Rhizobiaceae bacterium]